MAKHVLRDMNLTPSRALELVERLQRTRGRLDQRNDLPSSVEYDLSTVVSALVNHIRYGLHRGRRRG